jgi:hypothetical protein
MPDASLQASRDPVLVSCFEKREMAMTYGEFWPHYLAAHADPRCRALHYAGTLAVLGLVLHGVATGSRHSLIAAPLVGYGAAWFGHVVFERNRPATFGHPLWSVVSDFRMLGLFLSGRLGSELGRHQIGRHENADSTADRRERGTAGGARRIRRHQGDPQY